MITALKQEYWFEQSFDTNLTTNYEVDSWSDWHIVREFISNALDSVCGDISRICIYTEDDYVSIQDYGAGYPLVYAQRIGASSKKGDGDSIGMFGEGTKLAILTCLRKGIQVSLASKDWMICPRSEVIDQDLEVLIFDIYKTANPVSGSIVRLQGTPEIMEIINNLHEYFLQFDGQPLGIFNPGSQAKLYNKGVFIKTLDSLFSYNISTDQLNRDRDVIAERDMLTHIKKLWSDIDDPEIIKTYIVSSAKLATNKMESPYLEHRILFFPSNLELWRNVFFGSFGENAVLYTDDIAARECVYVGYEPVKFHSYVIDALEFANIPKDINVLAPGFEYTFVEFLSYGERQKIENLTKIAGMLELPLPEAVKVFAPNEKTKKLLGAYQSELDHIYLNHKILAAEFEATLDTFIHELMHRKTEANDCTREFQDGLTRLISKVAIKLAAKEGIPSPVKVTPKGFQLPKELTLSAENLTGQVVIIGPELMITCGGHKLKATLPDLNLKPYAAVRKITFFQGAFYLNIPATIREQLPEKIVFYKSLEI